jgi:hypothetical protein
MDFMFGKQINLDCLERLGRAIHTLFQRRDVALALSRQCYHTVQITNFPGTSLLNVNVCRGRDLFAKTALFVDFRVMISTGWRPVRRLTSRFIVWKSDEDQSILRGPITWQ